ncbi:MAG: phosphopantetheine-binding protein [Desulfosalsimonadaceae bacterium]
MKEIDSLNPIETALLDFVRREIYDPSLAVDANTHLIEAGLDSFSLLKILVFVEKKFNLRIPEAEINEERMCSVQNISRLIHELQQCQ